MNVKVLHLLITLYILYYIYQPSISYKYLEINKWGGGGVGQMITLDNKGGGVLKINTSSHLVGGGGGVKEIINVFIFPL